MKRIAFLLLLLSVAVISNAQKTKPFIGILNIAISYDGTWDAATLAQQPKEMTITIANNKSKTEMLAGGASIITIVNGSNLTQTLLINAMGMKFYVKTTKEDIEKDLAEKENEPVINYLPETKTIAGLTAKKAEYITTDEFGDSTTTIIYYSEEVGNENLNYGGQFHGLKGFPLEYIVETEQGKITFLTVTIQKKKKLNDTLFLIPSDYEEMSRETLKGMFGG
jgi:hypothetical protein